LHFEEDQLPRVISMVGKNVLTIIALLSSLPIFYLVIGRSANVEACKKLMDNKNPFYALLKAPVSCVIHFALDHLRIRFCALPSGILASSPARYTCFYQLNMICSKGPKLTMLWPSCGTLYSSMDSIGRETTVADWRINGSFHVYVSRKLGVKSIRI
jgi:hypothetical protein